MNDLIIIGASGFGREVAWLTERINSVNPTWNIKGFIDDNSTTHGTFVGGYPVLGDCYKSSEYQDSFYICAIGATKTRKKLIEKLQTIIAPKFATLIDPSIIMSNRVRVGEGSIICAGSVITVDVQIGKHAIINLDCTIGHDAILKDFVTLYPSVNVSGNTYIGECVELGTGVQIIQARSVGDEIIVGAGATVVKDITEAGTYVGVPATLINLKKQ